MKLSKKAKEADKELYKIGKSIEVLAILNWPLSHKNKFLAGLKKQNPKLPKITYKARSFSDKKDALLRIIQGCSREHPVENLIASTSESFYTILSMLENMGHPVFLGLSQELYGDPNDSLNSEGVSAEHAAKKYLKAVKEFDLQQICPPALQCVLPSEVQSKINQAAVQTFGEDFIKVKLSKRLKSKASASYKTIKVREGTCFSNYEL